MGTIFKKVSWVTQPNKHVDIRHRNIEIYVSSHFNEILSPSPPPPSYTQTSIGCYQKRLKSVSVRDRFSVLQEKVSRQVPGFWTYLNGIAIRSLMKFQQVDSSHSTHTKLRSCTRAAASAVCEIIKKMCLHHGVFWAYTNLKTGLVKVIPKTR